MIVIGGSCEVKIWLKICSNIWRFFRHMNFKESQLFAEKVWSCEWQRADFAKCYNSKYYAENLEISAEPLDISYPYAQIHDVDCLFSEFSAGTSRNRVAHFFDALIVHNDTTRNIMLKTSHFLRYFLLNIKTERFRIITNKKYLHK